MRARALASILVILTAAWISMQCARAAGNRIGAPDDEASLRRGQAELRDEMARIEQRRKREMEEFIATVPARPGSDRDFPYHQALYPIIESVPGAWHHPSLCIAPDGADAQLWCNAVGGPSIVRGDKIKIFFDMATLINCPPALTKADDDLQWMITGASTWRRDRDVFYLGSMQFRIDPDPRSCGSNRRR
jgi:hypothetical protein